MADYEKQKKNECSLVAGQTIEVIDKNANGEVFAIAFFGCTMLEL